MYGNGCAGSTASGVSTGNTRSGRACAGAPARRRQVVPPRRSGCPPSASAGRISSGNRRRAAASGRGPRPDGVQDLARLEPEAAVTARPVAMRRLRPATRTMKNSSRLLAKIARNRIRSSAGGPRPPRARHPLVERQPDSSRSRKRSAGSAGRPGSRSGAAWRALRRGRGAAAGGARRGWSLGVMLPREAEGSPGRAPRRPRPVATGALERVRRRVRGGDLEPLAPGRPEGDGVVRLHVQQPPRAAGRGGSSAQPATQHRAPQPPALRRRGRPRDVHLAGSGRLRAAGWTFVQWKPRSTPAPASSASRKPSGRTTARPPRSAGRPGQRPAPRGTRRPALTPATPSSSRPTRTRGAHARRAARAPARPGAGGASAAAHGPARAPSRPASAARPGGPRGPTPAPSPPAGRRRTASREGGADTAGGGRGGRRPPPAAPSPGTTWA